ncbi:MAG: hypothetical protein U1E36_06770 [Rickettsiales bacterium]
MNDVESSVPPYPSHVYRDSLIAFTVDSPRAGRFEDAISCSSDNEETRLSISVPDTFSLYRYEKNLQTTTEDDWRGMIEANTGVGHKLLYKKDVSVPSMTVTFYINRRDRELTGVDIRPTMVTVKKHYTHKQAELSLAQSNEELTIFCSAVETLHNRLKPLIPRNHAVALPMSPNIALAEFIYLANNAVGTYAQQHRIPVLYSSSRKGSLHSLDPIGDEKGNVRVLFTTPVEKRTDAMNVANIMAHVTGQHGEGYPFPSSELKRFQTVEGRTGR